MSVPWFGPDPQSSGRVEVNGREYKFSERSGCHGQRLWSCCVSLARLVSARDWSGLSVCDAGCGLGLAGMACLSAGAARVTFLDRDYADPDAPDRLLMHLWRCGLPADRVEVVVSKWGDYAGEKFDSVIGSEILYPSYDIPSLGDFLSKFWNGRGPCILANSPFTMGQNLDEVFSSRHLSASALPAADGVTPSGNTFRCEFWQVNHAD